MKFVRYIFTAIILLLAVYGGIQLYQQRAEKTKISEEALQEMRDSGFDVGSGNSKEALSSILQSDLGTPTASYGMNSPVSGDASMAPGTSGHTSGLPASLRNGAASTSTVAPETDFPFSTQNPPQQPSTPNGQGDQSSQINTTALPFNSLAPSGTSGIIAPDFLSPDKMPIGTPGSSDAGLSTQQQQDGFATTTSPSNTTATNASQPNAATAGQEDASSLGGQGPSSPSPYTFGVVTPPGNEIDTTASQPETQSVVVSQVVPGTHQTGNPCIQPTPAYQSRVAVSPQVQPLPLINDPATTASVSPPAFVPRLNVTALPPVENEMMATNANPPSFGDNVPAQSMALQDTMVQDTMSQTPTFINATTESPYSHHYNAAANAESVQVALSDHGTAPNMAANGTAYEVPSVPESGNSAAAPMFLSPSMTPASPPGTQQTNAQPLMTPLHQANPSGELPQQSMQQLQTQPMQTQPMQTQPTAALSQPVAQGGNGVVPLPQSQNADVASEVILKVTKIGELLAKNETVDAYEQLSHMYFYDQMTPLERQYVAQHLDLLAGGLLFSNRHHVLEPPYVVKTGDTIETIAAQYKITSELLRKLNGLAAGENAAVGSSLKVVRGPLDARIYPHRHELVVVSRGNYACRFPISVGSGYAGQEGTFTVQEKAKDRAYQLAPGLGTISPGDPNNPLGSRWIELSKEQGTIGVHGTNVPESVGTTRQSAGFFGLREQDINEVYDMLVVGSNVTIVR